MKKILLILPLAVLSACGDGDDEGGNWSNDCWTYHSINSRELNECKKKVEEGRLHEIAPNTVSIDKSNQDRSSFKELGKDRDSSAST